MSPIAANLASVHEAIERACARAGRDPASVRLLAVSKFHTPEAIREAYAAGQRDFAENYVQELVAKADALADLPDARFHFIGHLQRNKAKVVARLGVPVQTVDSVRLAEALGAVASADRPLPIHVQVNVSGEPQKSGCTEAELPLVVAAVRARPALRLEGLMTVPPEADDAEASRPYFRRLRELARDHGLASLSMGMSHDLEVAVDEGATWVRVGTAIFGPRPASRPA